MRPAAGAVEAVVRLRPDVVLLDIRMPGSGIAAETEISRLSPAGALGYVLKGADRSPGARRPPPGWTGERDVRAERAREPRA